MRIVFLVYTLLTWIAPQASFMQTLARIFEPMLTPVRNLIFRLIPSARTLPLDFSPVVFILLISVAQWLLTAIQRILL